ncbi:E3 ubiquitin-protein ligase MARCH1-like isoform X10 [Nasonia vitripennis]|uniref:RING-CH-type domain-containing protein n=1 Tax=Nasonia vitripennis TaxID=7425 RepID=A0A7M7Q4F4_NASVI|nr:E3 ubiquitin-protein ligase MARCH1-like isoform X10 [Nasonia vitripennis]
MTVDAGVNPSGEPAVQSERPGAALPANDRDKADQQRQQQHQQGPAAPAPEGQQSEEEEQRPVAPGSRSSLCRICRASSWTKEPLISPCRCKGTQAHVHLSCLERWLNQSCRNYCELCNFRYNALETPRYGWNASLRARGHQSRVLRDVDQSSHRRLHGHSHSRLQRLGLSLDKGDAVVSLVARYRQRSPPSRAGASTARRSERRRR